MGLTITANNSEKSFHCTYGGFFNLRKNIATLYDAEFGEHYSTLMKNRYATHFPKWQEKMNEILSDERFKEDDKDLLDFFFAPDCEGAISHKTCKKIFDIIKDVDFGNRIFTYGAHSDGKDYERLKEFLRECYHFRRKMRWY